MKLTARRAVTWASNDHKHRCRRLSLISETALHAEPRENPACGQGEGQTSCASRAHRKGQECDDLVKGTGPQTQKLRSQRGQWGLGSKLSGRTR